MRSKGFTLIEVMITVAIIGILAAIAIPSYVDYIIRGRIPEATNALSDLRTRMEQYYQNNRTYAAAGGACGIAMPANTQSVNFNNAPAGCATNNGGQGYVITVAGLNRLAGFTYTINQAGTQTSNIVAPAPTNWRGASGNCWIAKQGTQCL